MPRIARQRDASRPFSIGSMNYQSLFASVATRPVRAGVVGVGEFGVSLAARDRRLEHLKISALADLDVARACERLVQALLYVESSAHPPAPVRAQETGHGHPLPA